MINYINTFGHCFAQAGSEENFSTAIREPENHKFR
jgi:hypothetical protein